MPRRFAALAALLVVALVTLPGCTSPRVNIEKTVKLDPNTIEDPAMVEGSSSQTIRIEFSATEPIDVYVAQEEPARFVRKSLSAQKRPDESKLLASKVGAKSDTLEVTVPSGKTYIILSGAKKPTEVKLKVNSI